MDFFVNNYIDLFEKLFNVDFLYHPLLFYLIFLLWYFIEFFIILTIMMFASAIFIIMEKKILTFYISRKTSNLICLTDCLQIIAHGIKLFFKEDKFPQNADKTLFFIAPIIVFAPVLFVWMLLPFGAGFLPVKSDVGILFFIAVVLMPSLGIFLSGYACCDKYLTISALKSCLHIICNIIPILLSALSIVILSDSMSFQDIVNLQYEHGLLSWYCFPAFIGFIVVFICICLMYKLPFNFSQVEKTIISNYNAQYSGIKSAMFYLAQYSSVFIICAFCSTIFLGGYLPPFHFSFTNFFDDNSILYGMFMLTEQFFWLFVKTIILLIFVISIKTYLPAMRIDTDISFCCKYLLPLSLINLLIVCLIKLGGLYG